MLVSLFRILTINDFTFKAVVTAMTFEMFDKHSTYSDQED